MKKIYITEKQLSDWLLSEGIEWSANDDGSVNFSVNHNLDDKSNSDGSMSVDTRVFGSKQNILHGDGTAHGRTRSLSQKYDDKVNGLIKFYDSVIKYIQNGRKGKIDANDSVPSKSVTAVKDWFDVGRSDAYIIDQATKLMNRAKAEANPLISTYNRITNSAEDEKIERYITGLVPDTDVKYISLFSMKDFNFSDAIKHGKLRPNSNTDELLGISKYDRNGKEIDVHYDNNITPNIAQNFSLNNVGDDHFKQQYQYQGGKYNTSELTATDLQRELSKTKTYTSINQFIDKSVIYASHVLKKENFIPTFIVAAPSSSQFNHYYCTNLSRKMGVEYVPDFFKRNAINVKFDGSEEELMRKEGLNQNDINKFKEQIKVVAYKEIMYLITVPFNDFIKKYRNIFSTISIERYSREKLEFDVLNRIMLKYVVDTIKENYNINQQFVAKYILDKLYNQNRLKNIEVNVNKNRGENAPKCDSTYILNEFKKLIKLKGLLTEFNQVLEKTYNTAVQYADILSKGYRVKGLGVKTKITNFEKHLRKYIHNFYVIADEHLTNGNLQKRYNNAKFLIFDEDINSGATLKLTIDALKDKLPSQNSNNILCLVNGYSASGF